MTAEAKSVWDLAKNFATVNRQWKPLYALCDAPALYAARAEAVSAWGVDQHVNHLGIVMNGIGRAIDGMLANPQQGAGLGPTHPLAMQLLEGGSIPRGVGKAPERLHPPKAPASAETRAMLQAAQALWQGLEKKSAQIETVPATYAHFALGNFTSKQWVRFMAVHTAHHYKIMRDILDAAGQKVPFDTSVEEVN